jgi:hypothetical protein
MRAGLPFSVTSLKIYMISVQLKYRQINSGHLRRLINGNSSTRLKIGFRL